MDFGSHATGDEGSSGHRKVAAAEGAVGTDRAGNTIGAGPGDYPGQECSKEKDGAGYWLREPGDRWGWTFLPLRRGYRRPPPIGSKLCRALKSSLSRGKEYETGNQKG
jgi:hypothetical protein